MATAIDKSVVSKSYKFLEVDKDAEPDVRMPALPDDYFAPVVQKSKLDPETAGLHLEKVSTKNNGEADWFHPSPITMFAQAFIAFDGLASVGQSDLD